MNPHGTVSSQPYHILALFNKHYNKWYTVNETEVDWRSNEELPQKRHNVLAKMVKKRVQNGAVEYMIHYVHKKRTNETWISVEDVYEINPQTKRVFGKFKAK